MSTIIEGIFGHLWDVSASTSRPNGVAIDSRGDTGTRVFAANDLLKCHEG